MLEQLKKDAEKELEKLLDDVTISCGNDIAEKLENIFHSQIEKSHSAGKKEVIEEIKKFLEKNCSYQHSSKDLIHYLNTL